MGWDNDFIATVYGHKFWPLTGEGELRMSEISHALSMICRFNGHVKKFLSVAEHSVLVSKLSPPEYALEGLLHDAAEAYLTDLPSPVKRSLPGYYESEARIERRISQRFRVVFPLPSEVKDADKQAMLAEAHVLMEFDFEADGYGKAPAYAEDLIHSWTPVQAQIEFRNRYEELRRI